MENNKRDSWLDRRRKDRAIRVQPPSHPDAIRAGVYTPDELNAATGQVPATDDSNRKAK